MVRGFSIQHRGQPKKDLISESVHGRKKPCLCIAQGNKMQIIATFVNSYGLKAWEDFIDDLDALKGGENNGR
jgi:hypothetical protein